MVTRSTDEAMALLKERRAIQIANARDVARELIARNGFTTSKAVQAVMVQRELIDPELGNFWLGAVFHQADFVWTKRWEHPLGEPETVKNKAHAWRPLKIWTLKYVINNQPFAGMQP